MYPKSAVLKYQQVNNESSLDSATPHKLIELLMQGALDKIRMAHSFMAQKDIANKATQISLAISILDGLCASLHHEDGNEIAKNLSDLYTYMMDRLVVANLQNDPTILEEVSTLMATVKSGWDQIKPKDK